MEREETLTSPDQVTLSIQEFSWFFKDIPKSRRKIEALGDGVRVVPAYDGMLLDLKAIKRGRDGFEIAS